MYLGNDSSNNAIISSNYSDLIFGRDQSSTLSEWMRIERDGNVGIGTTSPTSLLEISQQLSASATIDYPYTISSRDDANSINQVGGEGVGIKFRIAGNAATTPGNSLVGASIAAIRESSSDTDSSTGLGFFVTQNDETLDEALRINHDKNAAFTGDVSLITGKQLIFDGGTDATYISEDIADRLRFFVGGAEFMRFTESTADTVSIFKDTTFSTQAFATTATSSGDASSTLTTKGYVDSLITGATIYRGTWDPDVSLNSGYGNPNLNTVTQTSGYYYICDADGTATPNGTGCEPNSWSVGDWVIWNDDIVDCAGTGTGGWQKIDNSSVLSGAGTGKTVALWEGASSVTDSETLGNSNITQASSTIKISSDGTSVPGTILEMHFPNNNTNDICSTINFTNNVGGYASIETGTTAANNSGYIAFNTDDAGTQGERLRITPSGNVGIGTINPGTKLEIEKADATTYVSSTFAQNILRLQNTSATDNSFAAISFAVNNANSATGNASILAFSTATDSSAGLRFQTRDGGIYKEPLHITPSGTIGINKTNPSEVYQVDMKRDMTDPDTAGYAMRIDTNMSGTKSAATDITQGALFLDTDSNAIGTTTDEHRVVGINNDVRYSGLPDAVYGIQSRVESNSTQTGQSTTVTSAYNIAQSDGGANHTIGHLSATYNLTQLQDNSTVSTAYGTRSLIQVNANRATNASVIYGSYVELDLDSTNSINYGGLHGYRAVIDNNQALASELSDTYLFRGSYNGVRTDGDCWGLYVSGDKHYLEGRLFVGTTLGDTDSIMEVRGSDAERYVKFKTSNDESRFDFYIGGTGNASRLSMFDSDGTTEGVRLSSSGNSYFVNNVGIGTTSPASKLQVSGSGNESVEIKVSGGTTAGNTGSISLSRTDGSGSIIQGAAFLSGGVPIGGIAGGVVGSSNTSAPAFAIQTPNSTNGHIVFNPKGTEKMRITSGGNVGIGATNPQSKLQVAGGIQMADDTDTASAAKVGTMRYRTGTEYVDVTGTDLVTNGDFATDTNWAKGTGVTIASGVGTWTNTANNVGLTQSVTFTSNAYYRCNVTVSNYSSGSFRFRYPGISSPRITANGTYSLIIQANQSANSTLYLQGETNGDANVNFSIDNVSVVEVTEEDASYADMCMQTGSSTYEWVNIVRNTY